MKLNTLKSRGNELTRDDIYDHLAQVYLGKRSESKKVVERKKKAFNAWLVINGVITLIIFFSAFYGLTAFLTQNKSKLESRIIYSLHNGPVRMSYNFKSASAPPTASISLPVRDIPAQKYDKVAFSIRAKEEGSPGIVKVVLKNQKHESASYYVQNVGQKWQKVEIPFAEFHQITDWNQLTDVSFTLESWNVDSAKGLILIDDIRFSG